MLELSFAGQVEESRLSAFADISLVSSERYPEKPWKPCKACSFEVLQAQRVDCWPEARESQWHEPCAVHSCDRQIWRCSISACDGSSDACLGAENVIVG